MTTILVTVLINKHHDVRSTIAGAGLIMLVFAKRILAQWELTMIMQFATAFQIGL